MFVLKRFLKLNYKVALGIAITLVLLQLCSAYVFGFIVQKQKQQQFEYFFANSPLLKVKQRIYHRGFFSSDATTELTINSQMLANVLKILPNSNTAMQLRDQSYSIRYISHIEHGIFAGILHGKILPTLSYAKTTVEYSDNVKAILNKFFNGKVPLEVYDITYLNKSGRIKFISPSFDYEEAVSGVKVVWGGLDASLSYNRNFTKFNNELFVPHLQLIAPTKGEIALEGLSYITNSTYSPNKIKIGDTNVKVNLAKVMWKDKIALNFKLGDVLRMITGVNSAEFLNGVDALNPSDFVFKHIEYASTSNEENNFFKASAKVGFDSLITNGVSYGPMNLNIALDHILAPQFSRLVDSIESFSANSGIAVTSGTNSATTNPDNLKREQFIKLLKANFAPILVESPVLTLSDFKLKTPSGLIKISGNVTTNNFVLSDMNNQDKFMSKVLLDLDFSVPKVVISYLFILQMKYLLTAGNAELDQQSAEALTKVVNILLDNQINTWTKKGYLKYNNGLLESHLSLHGSKLMVNGVIVK